MSRKVDVDNLSADDAQYMKDRPWTIAEAKFQGVDDIEDRIKEALDPDPEPEVQPAGEGDEAAVVVNYGALGLPALRKLTASRGLPATGGKKALVEVLEATDVSTGVTATVSREAEGAVAAVAGEEPPGEAPRGAADGTGTDPALPPAAEAEGK